MTVLCQTVSLELHYSTLFVGQTIWGRNVKIKQNLSWSYSQGGPGSVQFGYGLGLERFERFRFSVPAVPLQKGLQYSFTGRGGSGSGFGSWRTVPAVPVPLSVSGKTVLTVQVSGSSSVLEPTCTFGLRNFLQGIRM